MIQEVQNGDSGLVARQRINAAIALINQLEQSQSAPDWQNITNKPTIPTATSQLTNDSGYLTTVSWAQVTGKPTIPTATSQLTNDSGYLSGALVIFKSAAESRISTTTPTNDSSLQFTATANTNYFVIIYGYGTKAAVSGRCVNALMSIPSGICVLINSGGSALSNSSTAGGVVGHATDGTTSQQIGGTASNPNHTFLAVYLVQIGATGGTVNFAWAQNVSNSTATTIDRAIMQVFKL